MSNVYVNFSLTTGKHFSYLDTATYSWTVMTLLVITSIVKIHKFNMYTKVQYLRGHLRPYIGLT